MSHCICRTKQFFKKPHQNEAALPSNSYACKCLVCSSLKGYTPCERTCKISIINIFIYWYPALLFHTLDPDLKELTPSWHNICGGTYLFSEDTKSWYHNNQIETIKNINHCNSNSLSSQLASSGTMPQATVNFMEATFYRYNHLTLQTLFFFRSMGLRKISVCWNMHIQR